MGKHSDNFNALGLYDPCCSTCPDLESAFSQVTDHYNSTINFFPKFAAFRSVEVCKDVLQKQSKDCCTFKNDRLDSPCERNCPSYGFIHFPERAAFLTVEACDKITCICKKDHKNRCHDTLDNCACDACRDPLASSLGFVNWPPRAYYHDIRACGKVEQSLGKKCCKKRHSSHGHGRKH